jgi:hypothetical protein
MMGEELLRYPERLGHLRQPYGDGLHPAAGAGEDEAPMPWMGVEKMLCQGRVRWIFWNDCEFRSIVIADSV